MKLEGFLLTAPFDFKDPIQEEAICGIQIKVPSPLNDANPVKSKIANNVIISTGNSYCGSSAQGNSFFPCCLIEP